VEVHISNIRAHDELHWHSKIDCGGMTRRHLISRDTVDDKRHLAPHIPLSSSAKADDPAFQRRP
jgi:hypothetical protein